MPLIDECLREAHDMINPRYLLTQENGSVVPKPMTHLRDSFLSENQLVRHMLKKCSSVFVFVATVGERLETAARRLADEENLIGSYVMDAIGSTAVEQVVDHVRKVVATLAGAQGLCTSKSLSPGHRDWDLGQQRTLFQLADSGQVGVYLTPLGVMAPRQSMSGIMDLGPIKSKVASYDPCAVCTKDGRPGRRLS